LLELMVINLKRMNESVAEEAQGVFNTLALIENLTEIDPKISEQLVEKTDFYDWVLKRLQKPEFDNNKQYVSEILAITLQTSKGEKYCIFLSSVWTNNWFFTLEANRLKLGELNGIDVLLTATAVGVSSFLKKATN
jgi:beta-catenin-like protein 1